MSFVWFFLGIAATAWALRSIKRFSLEASPDAHGSDRA